MAEQADVFVKNTFPEGSVQVIRYLSDGNSDLEVTIASGGEEKIFLGGTEVHLIINAPGGVETKERLAKIRSDLDLAVSYSPTNSNWKVQIPPNNSLAEVPTTVNISIGDQP
jgi:hypothetical protein